MTSILVVDDEPHLVRTLAINLRARDYSVETAGDGRSALQAFHDAPPDLVVLDLGLPDLDGVEVLRRMRQTSRTCRSSSCRPAPTPSTRWRRSTSAPTTTSPSRSRMDELLARVRVALRRREDDGRSLVPPVQTPHFSLDFAERRAVVGGMPRSG